MGAAEGGDAPAGEGGEGERVGRGREGREEAGSEGVGGAREIVARLRRKTRRLVEARDWRGMWAWKKLPTRWYPCLSKNGAMLSAEGEAYAVKRCVRDCTYYCIQAHTVVCMYHSAYITAHSTLQAQDTSANASLYVHVTFILHPCYYVTFILHPKPIWGRVREKA